MTQSDRPSIGGTDVSRETFDRLRAYLAVLEQWNPKINLVSRSTIAEAWSRHFEDSAQIFSLAPANARTWVDLGSGGGFPGLVIGILAAELRPELKVTLVESDVRKATFLRTVRRELGLAVEVQAERIEKLPPANADVLSARALASLPDLLAFAERHGPCGICLFPKGANVSAERQSALETWTFDCEDFPSQTDPASVILRIGNIKRV